MATELQIFCTAREPVVLPYKCSTEHNVLYGHRPCSMAIEHVLWPQNMPYGHKACSMNRRECPLGHRRRAPTAACLLSSGALCGASLSSSSSSSSAPWFTNLDERSGHRSSIYAAFGKNSMRTTPRHRPSVIADHWKTIKNHRFLLIFDIFPTWHVYAYLKRFILIEVWRRG